MKYRQINTKFWEDGYISDLTLTEKMFFLYLFTNNHVNLCGIYELPDKYICSTLDFTLEQLEKLKIKLQNNNKYAFFKNWIFIINFSEHNKYSWANNILKSFIKDFNSVPNEIYNYFFNELKLSYIPPIENWNKVMVMDKVIVKEGRGYGRGYPRIKAKLIEENEENNIVEDFAKYKGGK